jgi:hypothetical protein
MVFVDHVLSFTNEGWELIEATTDGMVPNAAFLGILMVLPLVGIWACELLSNLYHVCCA